VRWRAGDDARVTTLHVAHTAHLDRASRAAARALLYDVFDDMTDEDWEHCLGGVHALVWDGTDLIGHASLIQRRLLHGGSALRAGYVEGVGVRADRRGRGHGADMMEALERLVLDAYDVGGAECADVVGVEHQALQRLHHVGALGTTDEAAAFYAARGWLRWQGPTSALTPGGIVRTPEDDGSVYVLPAGARFDIGAELTCDWRDGDTW
jgi:aminoglycoside 2'-N-acetyltransferase I